MLVFTISRRRGKLLLAAAALLLLCRPYHLLQSVASETRLVPIYEVDTERQQLAISFDASWGAEYTPALLDILDQYQVKTTFFLVNIWLEDYPDMAREIAARGHEIGLHSVTHPHFSQLSDEQIIAELSGNDQLIRELTGYQPRLFRPPYGDYNNRVIELCAAQGYKCIQWSVDSLDWQDLSAAQIVERVMKKADAGDIVLFHNNGLHTAEALPLILEQLQRQGLEVVPVSELLLDGDYYVDNNGVQRRNK
ncbi:MAG: polysaccharide deacetylase family protein [Bacillota bacterium]|nr:polysaccharide deacetylase family protein [Bacillota bacterium]